MEQVVVQKEKKSMATTQGERPHSCLFNVRKKLPLSLNLMCLSNQSPCTQILFPLFFMMIHIFLLMLGRVLVLVLSILLLTMFVMIPYL